MPSVFIFTSLAAVILSEAKDLNPESSTSDQREGKKSSFGFVLHP
jgi:hypothetical protein